MILANKKVWAIICVAVIVSIIVIIVWRRDTRSSNIIIEQPQTTKNEISKQPVQEPTISLKNQARRALPSVTTITEGMPHIVVKGLATILDIATDLNASVLGLLMKPERLDGKLRLRIWSRQGGRAVVITHDGLFENYPYPENEMQFITTDTGDFYSAEVCLYKMRSNKSGYDLLIETPNGSAREFIGPFRLSAEVAIKGYSYAAGIKEKLNYDPVSVVIIDLKKLRIACEIPLPQNLPRVSSSRCILDPKTDCLMVADMDINWFFIIDLINLKTKN